MSTREEQDPAARWEQVCAVLDAVLDAEPGQRDAVLDAQTGKDAALRAEVEALLAAQSKFDTRLETPVVERSGGLIDEADAALAKPDVTAGETIGPWRLVRELGRGGMGSVWLAERADGAFEQRVALKLLKRGLDSDAILERFLAERQILARLQHPHIAHLVDGGLTPDGRPYFAMELIDGQSITQWCDAQHLTVQQRLQLFLAVADAVQYAHGQLVVHRDLKPSNILVTPQGEVKLLDFGIAKLLDADAARADAATLTQLGIRMLTPEYAAPEQLRGDAVTTSTDVYALGVLLYELLAGRRPPPATETAQGRLPPRLSTQIDSAAAQARATSPEKLVRALRGDLDTIALRALHPEPERRYPTAEALGADLRRHLNREPVQARPDSLRYRAGRFVSRNRLGVAAAALVLLTLVGGIVATTWQAREARQQAKRAEQVRNFLVTVFEAGSPQEWRGKDPTARDLLDAGATRADSELSSDPRLHAEMLGVIGALYTDQGDYDRAEVLLKRSLDERERLFGRNNEAYGDSIYQWSRLLQAKGDWKEGRRTAELAVDLFERLLGDAPRTALAIGNLADAHVDTGDAAGAIRLRRESLAMHRRIHGDLHPDVADDLRSLGALLIESEQFAAADPYLVEAIAIDKRLYGPGSVRYALSLNARARLFYKRGEPERAAQIYRQVAEIYAQAKDPMHQEDALNHYGIALCRLGRFGEAEQALRQSLSIVRNNRDVDSQWVGIRLISLGECLIEAGRPEDAESSLREGLTLVERGAGDAHQWSSYALSALVRSLTAQGRWIEATPIAERALRQFEQQHGPNHIMSADSLFALGRLRFDAGQRDTGLRMARAAEKILRDAYGPQHPQTAAISLQLIELELRAGMTSPVARRLPALEAIFAANGDRHRRLSVKMLAGVVLARSDKGQACKQVLRQVLAERAKMYGASNAKTDEAANHLRQCDVRVRRQSQIPGVTH